jgi:CsoR family transcriptional regulator, copper-sensing transcriptional repressor
MRQNEHRHPGDEAQNLALRARKIGGQVAAVERMLKEDYDCTAVLMQIIAARRGLKSLSEKIIQSHLKHCIEEASTSKDGQKNIRELVQVLKSYID